MAQPLISDEKVDTMIDKLLTKPSVSFNSNGFASYFKELQDLAKDIREQDEKYHGGGKKRKADGKGKEQNKKGKK